METTKKYFKEIGSNEIVEVDAFEVGMLDESIEYRNANEEWAPGSNDEFLSKDGTVYYCQFNGQCTDHHYDEFRNVIDNEPIEANDYYFEFWAGHESDGANFFLTIYSDQNGWEEVEMPEDGTGERLRSHQQQTKTLWLRKNSDNRYFIEIDSRYPMSDFFVEIESEDAEMNLPEMFEKYVQC